MHNEDNITSQTLTHFAPLYVEDASLAQTKEVGRHGATEDDTPSPDPQPCSPPTTAPQTVSPPLPNLPQAPFGCAVRLPLSSAENH